MTLASEFFVNQCLVIFSLFRDFDAVIRAMSDAWSRANSWSTRQQILSIIAFDLPTRIIKEHFPNVTE